MWTYSDIVTLDDWDKMQEFLCALYPESTAEDIEQCRYYGMRDEEAAMELLKGWDYGERNESPAPNGGEERFETDEYVMTYMTNQPFAQLTAKTKHQDSCNGNCPGC